MSDKGKKGLLYVISYHHACNDGTLMTLVALLPILVVEMDLSYSEIGLLGLGLVITVVFQLVVGNAADRMASKYLLEVGAALMAASFMMVLLVNDFVGLFAAVIAMRLGASFYHPVGISWITRVYSGKNLENSLGVQSGIGNLGVIVALATSGYLGEAFGWKAPCVLWAVLNFVAIALGTAAIRAEPLEKTRTTTTTKRPIAETLKKVAPLSIPVAAGGALYQVTSYYGPVNLTSMHGWSAGSADLVFAIWIGVGTITSYYFGRMSHRYGGHAILVWGYLISAAAAILLFLTAEWYLVVIVLGAFGAVLFLTYPALFSAVTRATHARERGAAFGLVFGFQLGGGAFVVYLCGVFADIADNPAVSFLVIAALGIASALIIATSGSARSYEPAPSPD
jgi:FSR family fosmidomycin resistance protein-like MFS transporter